MSELAIRRGAAPALAVEGLTYTYPRAATPALLDVSLEVAPGEFVLLAGRSASGKSTLLRAACGLVLAVFSLGVAFLKRGDAFAFIFAFPDVIAVLSGVFYPVTVFPRPVQAFAQLLPTTHAFNLLKSTLGQAPAEPGLFLATLLPWLAAGILFTQWALAKARREGKLVKMK